MAKKPRTSTATQQLLHVVMLVMRTLAAEMRRSPTPLAPAQFGLLIKMAESPCSMSDLARHHAVSLPTISKSVDMLVRRGWVERWISTHDRRQTMVRLSASGRRVLADMRKQAERHVGKTLERLGAKERDELVSALKLLTKVLADPNDPACTP